MTIDSSLIKLENMGLIQQAQLEPELEYMFRHALVQDASYESLLKADRRSLHATVGKILEKLYASRLDELAATLADHYEKAENYSKALEFYIRAGKFAAGVYANVEASLLLLRAIEISSLPESKASIESISDAFNQYGRVLELSGDFEAAIENYRQMQAEAIRLHDKRMELDALIAQAVIQATPSPVHNLIQAQSLCEQALGISETLKNREAECRIYWILLLIYYFAQDNQKSIEYGKKSLEIARAIDNHERMAFTLNDIARSYYAVGDFDSANSSIIEARALWEELGNMPMLADNLNSYAESRLFSGNFEESLSLTRRAYDICSRINNTWGRGYSLSVQIFAHWYQGNTAACLRTIDVIKEIEVNQSLPFMEVMSATLSMEMYTELGLFDEAQRTVEDIRRVIDHSSSSFDGFYELGLAYVASAQGDIPYALEQAALARQKFSGFGFSNFIPYYLGAVEYRIGMDSKNYADLAQRLALQIQELQNSYVEIFVVLLKYWRGNALLHNGQRDEGHFELTQALESSERLGIQHVIWRVRAALAAISVDQGSFEAASLHRQRAAEVIHFIASQTPEPFKTSYLNQPEVKAALTV